MATNGNKKNKKSEEKTRYTRDDDNITLEIDEDEVNNLLYSPDSEPEAFHSSSSPSNNTEVGREESTALTHCDEKMDLTTPLDDSSKVDGSGDEKVDGLLAASSLEESSAAPTGVGSKCMLSGQRGDEKVDGLLAASRLEESSSAPALVETQGKNSGTSPPVTMAQVMALLQAHGGKLLGQLSDHNRRLVALEDPSPGVDAGTQTTNPARKLKRKLSNETKQNIKTYRERKEAGIARDGSMPSDLYKMGFRSYKGLKVLVQRKTAKEVLAQLGCPLVSFSSWATRSSSTCMPSSGLSCGPMAASMGLTPTWMKSSSAAIPLWSKPTVCFPGSALQFINGLQINQQPAGRNSIIPARKSSSMTVWR